MDPTLLLSALLVGAVLLFVIAIRYHREAMAKRDADLAWANEERRRLQAERGRWGEPWAPLLSGYPYDPRRFRFVGSPVEGVQFEDDRIVFVSLGTAPPAEAEKVRALVAAGRVEFHDGSARIAPTSTPTPSFAPADEPGG